MNVNRVILLLFCYECFKINKSLSIERWYQKLRKEGVQMKLRKTIQKKFRIDTNTEKALQIVLTNNKVSFQLAMESLLRECIYNNLEIVIKK